jgi:hypothetical protein
VPQLLLLPAALGHVRAADEQPRPALLVRERGDRPGDDALLAVGPHEHVLLLGRRAAVAAGGDERAHGVSLVRRDELLPERAPPDGRVVGAAADLLEGAVEADDAAVEVDDAEQARRRVRDRGEEVSLPL